MQRYLSEPATLLADTAPPRVQQLAARVVRAVALGRSPSALFAGLEAHVKRQLADDAFPRFLASVHYQRLCDALRERRELPLGEVLVSRQRTRFLERHLRAQQPDAVGNLRFWVDVQTGFLPLIQTTLFSVALFEEIQATVRRIFNAYLTASSPSAATVVSDDIRKDTLKKIMMLQGEPFSPPRYAGLFRRAQEKVWEWLQADVYPTFRQSSPLYVLLVIEIENLESDRQLRRLSEQVRARGRGHASDAVQKKADNKSSSVVVPVVPGLLGAPVARTAARLRGHSGSVRASAFQREIEVEELHEASRRLRVGAFFHSLKCTPATTATDASAPSATSSGSADVDTSRFEVSYDLVCRSPTAPPSTNHLVRTAAVSVSMRSRLIRLVLWRFRHTAGTSRCSKPCPECSHLRTECSSQVSAATPALRPTSHCVANGRAATDTACLSSWIDERTHSSEANSARVSVSWPQ